MDSPIVSNWHEGHGHFDVTINASEWLREHHPEHMVLAQDEDNLIVIYPNGFLAVRAGQPGREPHSIIFHEEGREVSHTVNAPANYVIDSDGNWNDTSHDPSCASLVHSV